GVCPAQSQIPQPGGLAISTDGLMESQGLTKCCPDAPRVGSDGFKLPDVAVLLFGSRLQRPEFRDHFLSDIERAVADGRQEPFVQANAVSIASKVPQLEWEMPQSVGAVNDCYDSLRSRQAAQPCDRKHLGRQVRYMAKMEHLRFWSNCLLKQLVKN